MGVAPGYVEAQVRGRQGVSAGVAPGAGRAGAYERQEALSLLAKPGHWGRGWPWGSKGLDPGPGLTPTLRGPSLEGTEGSAGQGPALLSKCVGASSPHHSFTLSRSHGALPMRGGG